jgi:NADH-quinone oxidoreductase subunit M
MGFVTIGTFSLNLHGVEGAIFQMLSHGIVSAALFLIVGVVYDGIHTRDIDAYGGLVHRMPVYGLGFMVFVLASVGLPGTGGFVGEFLVLLGAFQRNAWLGALTATGVILGAVYMLYLYRRVIYGKLTKDSLKGILDLSPREVLVFAPLIAIVIWMGVYPAPFLDVMHVSVSNLIAPFEAARALAEGAALAGR